MALQGFLPAEVQVDLFVGKVPLTLLVRQAAAELGSQQLNKTKMQDGLTQQELAQEEL